MERVVARGDVRLPTQVVEPGYGRREAGGSLYEVEPGRRAWPFHYHAANEEAIYVLDDSGALRIGEEVAVIVPQLR